MARIKKNQNPGLISTPEEDDFMREILGGCEMSDILMDMLEMAIKKQNPFSVSIEGDFENKLLGLYGYDVAEFKVKETDGRIETYEGAIKKGETVPKSAIDRKEFMGYLKKGIIEKENQRFILRLISWFLKKMSEDDRNSTGDTEEA